MGQVFIAPPSMDADEFRKAVVHPGEYQRKQKYQVP